MLAILFSSITYAAILGIGCASITLLYASTRTFNFAHASMISWGFYIVFVLYKFFGYIPYLYVPIAALIAAAFGILIYYFVIRRLLDVGASEITLMMVTLGVDLILFAVLNMFVDILKRGFGIDATKINIVLTDPIVVRIWGTPIKYIHIISIVSAIVIVVVLHLFLTRTNLGIAMRASIENPTLASILGIDVNTVYLFSWFIGGLLAGLSGGLLVLFMEGTTTVGFDIVVFYFAGSIVGGLYSIYGGLLGGVLVGFSERFLTFLLSYWIPDIIAYRFAIPMVMLVATLLIYPKGLAGLVKRV
ncbi:MAG: branched-chain amino acid ABC transporter permease [Ignisphaera sp.]|nr:branched-chain amino acid ABC transporter permease [Ignisphaera sp.]MCX8167585.1 branched-chain amino acid ABC transporter permease [Ignisphaera sp.]MDW8085405.1 branched-chain amino acid ABC transporter permease [Ignisphaera sp.]